MTKLSRPPAVAGQFYPEKEKELAETIGGFLEKKPKKKALGAVSPHAGYFYSGKTAGKLYSLLESPSNVIIIGPNHTGDGEPIAFSKDESWETPLGKVKVNRELCDKIVGEEFYLDDDAHEQEHSIEVQLPFMQTVFTDFSIVPICLGDQSQKVAETLGKAIAKNAGPNDLVLASTDFSHYEPYNKCIVLDSLAIKEIMKLSTSGLYTAVEEFGISMCGYGCVAATMEYAKLRGAKKAALVDYSTSADATGEKDEVVGYASLTME